MEWLNRSLISCDCYYTLCLTKKDFHRALRYVGLSKDNWPDYLAHDKAGATTHFLSTAHGNTAIVTMADSKSWSVPQIHSLLVHEAVHIWQSHRDSMCEDRPSSEFEAYAIQALSQRLIESYQNQTKKKAGKAKGKK